MGGEQKIENFTGITDYALELRPTYRLLPRGSGCGPDRFFNEYLILLTRGYDDAEAASAMLKVDKLESDVVNGRRGRDRRSDLGRGRRDFGGCLLYTSDAADE